MKKTTRKDKYSYIINGVKHITTDDKRMGDIIRDNNITTKVTIYTIINNKRKQWVIGNFVNGELI